MSHVKAFVFGALCLFALGSPLPMTAGRLPGQEPCPKDVKAVHPSRKDERDSLQKLVARTKERAKRVNGVLLTAKVEIESDPDVDRIRLHWSVDYNGPRQPFIMLKPSLEAHNQTYALVYVIHSDRTPYLIPIRAEPAALPIGFALDHFLKAKQGQTVQGTLNVIDGVALARFARHKWPEKFQPFRPMRVFIQLRHSPTERGACVRSKLDPLEPSNIVSLDAWTGRLQTELLEVPLAKIRFPE